MKFALNVLCLGATLAIASACAMDRPMEIPADAVLASEGNQELSYRAPSSGTVYVWDDATDRIVYSGRVNSDQVVRVDVKNDQITIDGKTVFEKGLRGGANHQIFFEREGVRVVEETKVTRETNIERD
jgi:hypothetical protein